MNVLKQILYFLVATLVTALLPFSGIFLPVFLVLSAALLVSVSVKWNYVFSLFATVFSVLLIYFTSNNSSGLSAGTVYLAIMPVVSFVSASGIYFALKAKLSVKSVLLSGTISYFLLIAVIYHIFGATVITDIINMMKTTMIESLDTIKLSLPADSNVMIPELKTAYELYFENLKVVAPSLILSFFFLISYFTIKISGRLSKNEKVYENIPSFSNLHAPAFLILITAVSYVGQLSGNGFFAGLMANVFMVLSIYYTLCGFSLIDFFLKKGIKKLWLRIIIYFSGIFAFSLFSFVLFFANPILIAMIGGMIDSLVNYRAKMANLTGK